VDEHRIADLLGAGAPLDAFGVGTDLVTSRDAPAMNAIYKLVEIERDGATFFPAKFSEGKITYPGKKQIHRFTREGQYVRDVVALNNENCSEAEPLLEPVIQAGRLRRPLPRLEESRHRAAQNLAGLPAACRRLQEPAAYPVERSEALEAMFREVWDRARPERVK
jgi:nicotinate phosphoribosyltransferase